MGSKHAGHTSLTHEFVTSVLEYNKDTGHVTWKKRYSTSHAVPGARAGILDTGKYSGYRRIFIKGYRLLEHRLIWFMVYGVWPTEQIDHVNGIRDDNRLCNLREASNTINCQNKRNYSNNKSGHKGVIWHKKQKKWNAVIGVNWKLLHLGSFDSIEEAIEARKAAEDKYFTY